MIVAIVFNPGVALLTSMTSLSCRQSVSISRRSSGLSGSTGHFRFVGPRTASFRKGLERCSGRDHCGACESSAKVVQRQDGGTAEALPGLRQPVIRDRRIFMVLPV